MYFSSSKFKRFSAFLNFVSSFRLSLFLILCFILGGTSQDIVAPKFPLYLISLFVIGGCLSAVKKDNRIGKLRTLLIIWGSFFALHLIYLIPLPPGIWSQFNGREFVAQGFQTLGMELPWLPISLTPEKTLFSLFDFLPPLAVILLMGTVVTAREFRIALWSLGVFVFISVILGMMQVASLGSELHFYDFTNERSAVGFFSNANHYGVFLLMSIPLLACLANYDRIQNYGQNKGTLTFCIICALAAFLGIGLSGSLGGYLLIIPILTATLFIWSSKGKRKNIYLIGLFVSLVSAVLFDMFIWNDVQTQITSRFASIDTSTRQIMFDNTSKMAKNFFPLGSGPGSFLDVYRLVEDVGRFRVPHSHNEYIEIIAEFGVFGIIGIGFLLLWLAKNMSALFLTSGSIDKSSKFMSVAIVTVLIYSIFDFPLRTNSVMTLAVFALCGVIISNKNMGTDRN